jgi:parallel beta-helix repeat protein
LFISEVLYDPTGPDPDREWIEVFNADCSPVNLSNYKVGDEVTQGGPEGMLKFPDGTSIAPGQAIVIAHDADAFYSANSFYPDYEMYGTNPGVPDMEHYALWADGSVALHNEGDKVVLLDASNDIVDCVSWEGSSYCFSSPPGALDGQSLERQPTDRDTDAAGDWDAQPVPTPGNAALEQVFSTDDCGPGSLRLHLLSAAISDTVSFDPSAFPPASPMTIAVTSALPPLVHDGLTVTGSAAGVVLDGSGAPAGTNGLVVQSDNCVVRELAIQGFVGDGVRVASGAGHAQVASNTLSLNGGYGVAVETCDGNTITQNAIYDNALAGIQSGCLPLPQIVGVTISATERITGVTVPGATVEVFSDDGDQGRLYEGTTIADGGGVFTFTRPGGFASPNLTATSTDASGNTSAFSLPKHLAWTLLIYINGDSNLEASFLNTFSSTVAAGPSPRANVLALVDGYTTTEAYSGTVLYDITRGTAEALSTTVVITYERNMGDGQTLVDFVTWGRTHYPARYTVLSILDHGGGWAPSGGASLQDALAHKREWMAGKSGLSWDFSDNYDHLQSGEVRQAMAEITGDGAEPLDVVFYDVCLMGMIEAAYQIKEYALYFVSSQNIGWAPVGPDEQFVHRYIRTIQGIAPDAEPRQMAELLVGTYAEAIPPKAHPFTISAVDLTELVTVTNAVDDLAEAISQTLTGPEGAAVLYSAYGQAQKVDCDSDFEIEPATDSCVDLYDFALRAATQYTEPAVLAAANAVTEALATAIVAEAHRSGSPWMDQAKVWSLDDVHGLSIFLPLGEDLELPISITETVSTTPTVVITRDLRLRDRYSCDEIEFACDTAWRGLIDTYYDVIASTVPTDTTEGPVDGLQPPDVTAPQTVITVTGALTIGQQINVEWHATDAQAGIESATLWHRSPDGQWASVGLTQTGEGGTFSFTLAQGCENGFAVRATDAAGNVESLSSGSNTAYVDIYPCIRYIYLPLTVKAY